MSSASEEGTTVVRVFRKRTSKTLKIEDISVLRPSERIALNIALDNNVYILNIGTLNNANAPYIYVAVDSHKDNTKMNVEFKVTLMDNGGRLFYQKSDAIKTNAPLLISTKYTVRDLPSGCLMIHYELSYLCWSEEADTQKRDLSFSHTENLSRDFGQLFSRKTNADVVIQVGNAEILVHSQILSARSEVFAAMFQYDMSEKRNRTIHICDIGALAMHYFLKYIYTGKLEEIIDLRLDTLRQLYVAADKYAVAELKGMCSEFLLSRMSMDSVASCAELGFRHNDIRMQDAVTDFFSRQTMKVLDSSQWRELEDRAPDVTAEVLSITCIKEEPN